MDHSCKFTYLLFGLGLIITSNAIATPNTVQIGITCPDATGVGSNTLSNFGSNIHGYGKESINSIPGSNAPYFSYHFTTGNFPANIADGAYTNTGVEYNPSSSLIICKFTSSNGFDPINVNYKITNGRGSVVLTQTQDQIVWLQYLGFKS